MRQPYHRLAPSTRATRLCGRALADEDMGPVGRPPLPEPFVRSVRTRLGRIREYRQRCDFVELWRFLDPIAGLAAGRCRHTITFIIADTFIQCRVPSEMKSLVRARRFN